MFNELAQFWDSFYKFLMVVLSFSSIVLLAIRANRNYMDSKFGEVHKKLDQVKSEQGITQIQLAEVKVKVERLWTT